MSWIVDRIEGDIAVCEANGVMLDIPLSSLPQGVKENDVIILSVDENDTATRKDNINNLMNSLFKD